MSDLRDLLITAYLDGDAERLAGLCHAHAGEIVRSFDGWAKVPAELREDQRAIETYVHVLAAVAQTLHAMGHPGPLRRLMPEGAGNPIMRWRYSFSRAQQAYRAGEYAASSAELESLLADLEGTTGPGVDDLMPKIHGLLGAVALELGRLSDALRHTEEALRRCVALDDREGIWIYRENLETARVAAELASGSERGRLLFRTRERIAYAQDLSDRGRYPASNDVLHDLLGELTGASPGTRYLGKVYGLLGLNHFRLGDLQAARACTERALAECREQQDLAGERIYTANLRAIATTP